MCEDITAMGENIHHIPEPPTPSNGFISMSVPLSALTKDWDLSIEDDDLVVEPAPVSANLPEHSVR